MSPADIRDTRTLIDAHRVFTIGRRIVANAQLEITLSETEVAREVDRTLELAGGLIASPDDTTHIDSLREDIERAVSDVIRERRRTEEAIRVRSAYADGKVIQIFLNQMMGAYRGELYEDGQSGVLTFTIEADTVASALGIELPREDTP